MTLPELASGTDVFLDANVFIYHFQPHPVFGASCTDLIERIERGDLGGYTSTHVFAETAHRLMTLEACQEFGWPFAGIAQRLRQKPDQLRTLVRFRQALAEIPIYGIKILTVAPDTIDAAASVSQQFGLLTNDALLVAVMQSHGLVNVASHDADFDRVPVLTRYAPV